MSILTNSLLLLILFAVLGVAADFAVRNIKYIASVLKMRLFAFGILLGLITTLPELSVGINATIDKAASLSAGNLLGGVIVLFGLVLGTSLFLNRQIDTDDNLKTLIPEMAVIFSPVLFGLDGHFGLLDGLMMIGLYLALLYYLYRANHAFGGSHFGLIDKNKIARAALLSIFGIIFILLAQKNIRTFPESSPKFRIYQYACPGGSRVDPADFFYPRTVLLDFDVFHYPVIDVIPLFL